MLSRTADHLFWMSRYTERAENTARILNVSYETSLLPQSATKAKIMWRGLLSISELTDAYAEKHGAVEPAKVLDFMVRDGTNPSSLYSCLRSARENARAVRGALTSEVWEALNQTWLELGRHIDGGAFERDPGEFFQWVKERSHLQRGILLGTMLQDEAFHFLRLGTFLERADNTARLIDVKFHAGKIDYFGTAESDDDSDEVEYDFYHWSAILRSVSAFEVYRKVFRAAITPERVAELLIFKRIMPRSLHCSTHEVVANLDVIANRQSGETQRQAGQLAAELKYGRIEDTLSAGLHAYLTQFLNRVNDLGVGISRDFLETNLE